jgi:hypothetical protein
MLYDKPLRIKLLNRINNYNVQNICSALLIILTCLSFLNLSRAIKKEIELPYSNAKAVATYVNSELPSNSIIVVTNDVKASAIAPYLSNQRLWNPITEKYFSFVTWNNERVGSITEQELEKKINENFYFNNVYLLNSKPCNVLSVDNYLGKLEILKVFDAETIFDENYYAIYYVDLSK